MGHKQNDATYSLPPSPPFFVKNFLSNVVSKIGHEAHLVTENNLRRFACGSSADAAPFLQTMKMVDPGMRTTEKPHKRLNPC